MQQRTRFMILKRDNFRCQYCGKTGADTVLEVDHITPVSKGGTDDFENLITACKECNRGKYNIEILPPVETTSLYESIENTIYKEICDIGSKYLNNISKIKALEADLLNLYLENKTIEYRERELELAVMQNKRDNWTRRHIDPIEDYCNMSLDDVKASISVAIIKQEKENL